MQVKSKDANLAVAQHGDGPPLVFLHDLGANSGQWGALIAHLPTYRCITIDMRGHGGSSVPDGPYKMGGLIADTETVMDQLSLHDAVVIGHGVGGMIAQGLAVKRLDLVRAMVLCATAAKFGQPDPWRDRAQTARAHGMQTVAQDIVARWGGDVPDDARDRVFNTAPEGYASCCDAIAGTDFYTPTSGLRLPTLGLCGDRDKTTPPDLVRETVDLIRGSEFQLLRGAGHLAPQTHGDVFAHHLTDFLNRIAHHDGCAGP